MKNMNFDVNDQTVLISHDDYYPVGIINQFVPETGGEANSKARGRRKKRKGGGGEGVMRKRKLSEEQASMLERSFGRERKLETERKERLAAEVGLDPRQVAVWFQNRRARWRAKKMEEECSRLRSDHHTTLVEKCHLHTQILKLKEQLHEAEKQIQRLSERSEGFTSNSPSSSLSLDPMKPLFLTEYGMEGMLENVFYMPDTYNYVYDFEWDDIYYHVFS